MQGKGRCKVQGIKFQSRCFGIRIIIKYGPQKCTLHSGGKPHFLHPYILSPLLFLGPYIKHHFCNLLFPYNTQRKRSSSRCFSRIPKFDGCMVGIVECFKFNSGVVKLNLQFYFLLYMLSYVKFYRFLFPIKFNSTHGIFSGSLPRSDKKR